MITAFVALKGIFESNAVIADKLSFIMSGVNKAFQFIIDTVVTTVSSFDNLKKALFSPIQFFSDLATGTSNAAKAGYEAAESIDAFAEQMAIASQEIEINEVRVKSLEKSLKDRTKSEQERIKIANQVADLEIQNARKREELAQKELANEQLRLKGKTLNGEELAQLKKLETKVFVEQEEAKTAAAERQTRINILLAKEEAAEKKQAIVEAAKQTEEELFRIKQDALAKNEELLQRDLDNIQKKQDAEAALIASTLAAVEAEFAAEDALILKDNERTLKAQQNSEARAKSEIGATKAIFSTLSELFKKGSKEQKSFALASIAIDTAEAIASLTAASEQNPANGFTFGAAGIAQFAAGIVRILANVGAAKGLISGFANGGLTGTRISSGMGSPINRSNGDNMLATVKTGEVILNQSQQARLGGAATFAKIGVPGFATGGVTGTFETSQANATASQSRIFSNLMKAIEKQKIVLPYEDFEIFTQTRTQIQETARVL